MSRRLQRDRPQSTKHSGGAAHNGGQRHAGHRSRIPEPEPRKRHKQPISVCDGPMISESIFYRTIILLRLKDQMRGR